MALTLTTTPGSATANSYCSVEAADLYHDFHPYADVWNAANASRKQQCLVMATRLLDDLVDWQGQKTTLAQKLRWPRYLVPDRDGLIYLANNTIPEFLQQATAELARYLVAEDRTEERGYGIKSVTADVVSVEFDSTDLKPVLPQSVRNMITPYGGVGSTQGFVPLVRR